MKLSFLIPFEPDGDPWRDRALEFTTARLRYLYPDAEICIGGDDAGLPSFCVPRMKNNAARQATGDVFVAMDCDTWFHRETLDRALEELQNHPWVTALKTMKRLDPATTQEVLNSGPECSSLPDNPRFIAGETGIVGTMLAFPRAAWESIGGHNEDFWGWGGEDVAIVNLLDKVWGKHLRLDDTIYHLFHARPEKRIHGPLHDRCTRIHVQYERRTGESLTDWHLGTVQRVDLFVPGCRERHYLDHAAPIWLGLPVENRGRVFIHRDLASYAKNLGLQPIVEHTSAKQAQESMKTGRGLVLLVGHSDAEHTDLINRRNAIAYHGTGFNFDEGHELQSYPGASKNRRLTELILCPSERVAEIERAGNPNVRVDVVGCPKLDSWAGRKWKRNAEPVIALGWHWDCQVAPETRTAFPHFERALPELAARWKILGHGHPRIMDRLTPIYESLGIEVVRDFSEVLERADLFACDASSTIYEFAATGRPVVVLNAPWYRRDIDFGIRFWQHADVGVNCDDPGDLVKAIEKALKDGPAQKTARKAAVEAAYGVLDGHATERAVSVLVEHQREMLRKAAMNELTEFRCPEYPYLRLSSLGVQFENGRYASHDPAIADALRRQTRFPIKEVSVNG